VTTESTPSSGSLWRHTDFTRLWSAHAVSAIGARITRDGLPLAAILTLDAQPAELGLLAALAMGPGIIVGFLSGGFVDRARRRLVLIAADLIRAAILLTIPVAAWFHVLSIAHLYIAAAAVGGANVLFEIASHAYLPALIGRNSLIEGNAKLGATDSAAEIGGPALAGVLFQVFTAPAAILANVATYLVSGGFLAAIKKVETPAQNIDGDWRNSIVEGFVVIFRHPLVRPIFLMTASANGFFGAFFGALYSVFAIRDLLLTPAMLGITIACGGIGAFAGAMFGPGLARAFGIGPAILLSLFLRGAFTLLVPLAYGPPGYAMIFLIAAQLAGDGFQVAAEISFSSLRQSILPLRLLGRAGAAFETGAGLTAIIGALAAGALAEVYGARAILWWAAIGFIGAPVFGLFSPLRRLRELPPAPD
jgi:predicted MFS family arabinose efflux permease